MHWQLSECGTSDGAAPFALHSHESARGVKPGERIPSAMTAPASSFISVTIISRGLFASCSKARFEPQPSPRCGYHKITCQTHYANDCRGFRWCGCKIRCEIGNCWVAGFSHGPKVRYKAPTSARVFQRTLFGTAELRYEHSSFTPASIREHTFRSRPPASRVRRPCFR